MKHIILALVIVTGCATVPPGEERPTTAERIGGIVGGFAEGLINVMPVVNEAAELVDQGFEKLDVFIDGRRA
ncbi:MAG: hypothetical protein OXC11_13530, partial [Rhodospirillales bacterium]|nr:hypothetical protein [Rhodospirillales bacterium]